MKNILITAAALCCMFSPSVGMYFPYQSSSVTIDEMNVRDHTVYRFYSNVLRFMTFTRAQNSNVILENNKQLLEIQNALWDFLPLISFSDPRDEESFKKEVLNQELAFKMDDMCQNLVYLSRDDKIYDIYSTALLLFSAEYPNKLAKECISSMNQLNDVMSRNLYEIAELLMPALFRDPTEEESQHFGNVLSTINRICGTHLENIRIVNISKRKDKYVTPVVKENDKKTKKAISNIIKESWQKSNLFKTAYPNLDSRVFFTGGTGNGYEFDFDYIELQLNEVKPMYTFKIAEKVTRRDQSGRFWYSTSCNNIYFIGSVLHEISHAIMNIHVECLLILGERANFADQTMLLASHIFKNPGFKISDDLIRKTAQNASNDNVSKILWNYLNDLNKSSPDVRTGWMSFDEVAEVLQQLGIMTDGKTLYINQLSDIAFVAENKLMITTDHSHPLKKESFTLSSIILDNNEMLRKYCNDCDESSSRRWYHFGNLILASSTYENAGTPDIEFMEALFKLTGQNVTFKQHMQEIFKSLGKDKLFAKYWSDLEKLQ